MFFHFLHQVLTVDCSWLHRGHYAPDCFVCGSPTGTKQNCPLLSSSGNVIRHEITLQLFDIGFPIISIAKNSVIKPWLLAIRHLVARYVVFGLPRVNTVNTPFIIYHVIPDIPHLQSHIIAIYSSYITMLQYSYYIHQTQYSILIIH